MKHNGTQLYRKKNVIIYISKGLIHECNKHFGLSTIFLKGKFSL